MKLNSIRWRFPFTYALIALITALVSGGTLLAVLRNYYMEQEQNYLQKNAMSIAAAITPILYQDSQGQGPDQESKLLADLKDHITLLSFLSQTRVRLERMDGTVVVDTGVPSGTTAVRVAAMPDLPPGGSIHAEPQPTEKINQALSEFPPDKAGLLNVQILQDKNGNPQYYQTTDGKSGNVQFIYRSTGLVDGKTMPADGPGPVGGGTGAMVLVSNVPLVSTMYGFELQSGKRVVQVRSNQMYKQAIQDGSDVSKLWGTLVISDGPAYGMDIVSGVARAWALASLLAIFIAALVGWWLSRRMSAPILALTEATGRMAEGDLSVRATARSQDELGRLAGSFNLMAVRVEEMVGALRRFAGDAAHELRTPLTALHTNLELLRSDPNLSAPAHTSLEQAWEETLRLETLSRDLLDLSRLEAGQPANPEETFDLGELVREACEPYASQAEQQGISFVLEIPPETVQVTGQRGLLCRAISNLLENAIKFTSQPGQVRVSLRCEGSEAMFEVQDTGIGIPSEDAPFVFNRFHRGRNATSYPGSGLGLAIVKAVMEKHSGRVSLEGMQPGTKVELRLPAFHPNKD